MSHELTPAQQDLLARARDLARSKIAPRAAETDRSESYPWANVEDLTAAGFMGKTVPQAYGGQGLSGAHQRVFDDETMRFELPVLINVPTIGIIAPTIRRAALC